MKQKIQPGTVLDFLSPEEYLQGMKDHTNSLLTALGRNAHYKRVVQSTIADGNGNLSITFSPRDGFMWSVAALFVATNDAAPAQCRFFFNDPNQTVNKISQIQPAANAIPVFFSKNQFVVHSSESVVMINTAPGTAGAFYNAMFHVIEVPIAHEAQLLL